MMLDLGLLEIILSGVFSISSHWGGGALSLFHFLTLQGKVKIRADYLLCQGHRFLGQFTSGLILFIIIGNVH